MADEILGKIEISRTIKEEIDLDRLKAEISDAKSRLADLRKITADKALNFIQKTEIEPLQSVIAEKEKLLNDYLNLKK